MSQQETLDIIIALIGGGALFKFLEFVVSKLFTRDKDFRDELRLEITRLENRVRDLEQKVEKYREAADDWKNKFYEAEKQYHLLEVTVASRDNTIIELRHEIERYENAPTCPLSLSCRSLGYTYKPEGHPNDE